MSIHHRIPRDADGLYPLYPDWTYSETAIVSEDARHLYHQAFERFITYLWNVYHAPTPTALNVMGTARALRQQGNRECRVHAEKMEAAIRAAN